MRMPLGDLFAPDTNFVSARSVYPTMGGGSTASAASAMSGNTNTVAMDPASGATGAATASTPLSTSGKSVYWWLGIVGLLAAMMYVARRAGGEEDFRNIRPTLYNVLTITLTAIVGIVGLKILATRFRIPGASDVILAA